MKESVRYAASLCLWHPETQQILMGRRLTSPWKGYWAVPGGGIEPGEGAFEAALRETFEETRVRVGEDFYLATTSVSVSRGVRSYHISSFLIRTEKLYLCAPTVELESKWVAVQNASELAPMGSGTQKVLSFFGEYFDFA